MPYPKILLAERLKDEQHKLLKYILITISNSKNLYIYSKSVIFKKDSLLYTAKIP